MSVCIYTHASLVLILLEELCQPVFDWSYHKCCVLAKPDSIVKDPHFMLMFTECMQTSWRYNGADLCTSADHPELARPGLAPKGVGGLRLDVSTTGKAPSPAGRSYTRLARIHRRCQEPGQEPEVTQQLRSTQLSLSRWLKCFSITFW